MISVLYVDDEPDLLEIGRIFLEQGGQFSVDTVTSAHLALKALESKSYDAVISDYQMPGMNGIELLRRIRLAGSTVPFIVFTGRGREEVVIQALNEGADFYLQKGGEPVSQFAELSHKVLLAVRERRAQDSIRDLERREADIINFLPDATFVIDREGQVIAWNKAMEEMTGIPAHAMIGKGDYEYAIPFYGKRRPILIDLIFAEKDEIERSYSGIIRDGTVLMAETAFSRLSGKDRYLWGKATPLYDGNGGIAGAIESIRDITEIKKTQSELLRKNEELSVTHEEMMAQDEELRTNLEEIQLSQKALRQSEQRLRGIADTVPGVVYQFYARDNGDCGLSFVSDRYEELFRATGELPMLFQRFAAGIAPEDQERFQSSVAAAIRTQSRWEFEGRFIRNDGSDIYFHAMSDPERMDGELVFSGILLDVTDRKRAEAALSETTRRIGDIIDFLPDATFVIDRKGTVSAWNKAMETLTGCAARDMLGKGDLVYSVPFYGVKRKILIDLVSAPDDEIRKDYANVNIDGGILTAETVDAVLAGKQVVLWGKAAPLFDSQGEIVGAIESIRDVTEQRLHSEALRQANRKLNLLSSVTRHDIINKITVLLGLLDISRKQPCRMDADTLYGRMKNTIRDIQGMIEFTRFYQDLGNAAPEWQDISRVLDTCAVSAIRLDDDTGHLEVYADPMLHKVFSNLLDNAIRHGDHATTVTVSMQYSSDGSVTIVWEDDGRGVPGDIKEQIFDRGFGSHTGFGLFLVREILGLTGITIRETGTEGKGARFEITVPEDKFRKGSSMPP